MVNTKKRNMLLATLVVALACAVFVNWYYTRPPADEEANVAAPTTTVRDNQQVNLGDAQYVGLNDEEAAVAANASAEYFASAKLRRQTAQDKAKDTLNKVINDSKADEKSKENASKALADLANIIKKEADIENLIAAKIAGDCLVILNGDSVEVIVQGGKLNDQSALQIKDICVKQTSLSANAVTVVEQR